MHWVGEQSQHLRCRQPDGREAEGKEGTRVPARAGQGSGSRSGRRTEHQMLLKPQESARPRCCTWKLNIGIKAWEGSPHRGHSSGSGSHTCKKERTSGYLLLRGQSVWAGCDPPSTCVCALRQQCRMQNVLVSKPASAARP